MVDEVAPRDDNGIPVIQGTSSVDEVSSTNIYVNPDFDGFGSHGVILKVEDE